MAWFARTKQTQPASAKASRNDRGFSPVFQAFSRALERVALGLLKHPSVLTFARLAGLAIVLNLLSVSMASALLTKPEGQVSASLSVGAKVLPRCEITSGDFASELLDDAPIQLSCWELDPQVETAPEARIMVGGTSHRVVITTINF